jgi:paraquat-inducible protein B
MSRKASPTLIGVFTLIALIAAGISVVLLGAGQYFQRTHRILLHFDKSAMGLLVGSDVRFGGVRIGRVADISVLVDHRNNRKIIPVIVELEEKDLRSVRTTRDDGLDFTTPEGVKTAVAQGLRAGMVQQSLLTGMLYIEFDIVPDQPGFVYEDADGSLPTVPTIPAEIDKLVADVADGLKKINSLDLDGMLGDVRKLLNNADRQLEALDMKTISDNLVQVTADVRGITGNDKVRTGLDAFEKALTELRALAAKLNEGVDPVLGDVKKVLAQAETGIAELGRAAAELAKTSNPRGPVLLRLQAVLDETERAARAIKELAEDLKRHPNSILVGKEPKGDKR